MSATGPLIAEKHFFVRLESLRGLAALAVVCFHVSQTSWAPGKELVTAPFHTGTANQIATRALFVLFNGQGAVNLFFVLSGLVLALSLARGPADTSGATNRFLVARVFRLFPAIWISVPIYAALFAIFGTSVALYPGDITLERIVTNLMLLDVSLNGVMWSLQIELLAVPLVLGLGLSSRRLGISPIVAAAVILFMLIFTSWWTRGPYGLSLNPLFAFALGMLARSAGALVLAAKKYQVWLLAIVAVAVFFAARPLLGKSTGAFRWITVTESIAAAIIVTLVAFRRELPVAHVLDKPIWRFYGRISYSLYLLHPLLLLAIWNKPANVRSFLEAGFPDAAIIIALSGFVIAVLTPLAWLSWRYVEIPGTALGRAVGRWLRRESRGTVSV